MKLILGSQVQTESSVFASRLLQNFNRLKILKIRFHLEVITKLFFCSLKFSSKISNLKIHNDGGNPFHVSQNTSKSYPASETAALP